MKVSIITVCYNSAANIEHAVNSVLSQDYPGIEYIIIDGKSTDGTLDIIKKYEDKISKIISEKDEGMYFAINKGIQLASGDIIGILNSDDFYVDDHVISKVVQTFISTAPDAVYADLAYVDKDDTGKISRYWKAGAYKHGLFIKGWMPPHPAFFVKKKIYAQYGGYNTKLSLSADYELMLRFIHKMKIPLSYLPQVIVKMKSGGRGNISFSQRLKANREDRLAWKLNGLKSGAFTMFLKPLLKIKQFSCFPKPA